ncbi:MAG: hypothetical protein JWL84_2040 [Rhodospirillales bacterium]|nr:hypothetical protein [Rhodospirillales bacterium]
MAERLKLRGEDEEDLAVISTILQDALVPIGDMAFLAEERRFVLVANRFCWECAAQAEAAGIMGEGFERVLTGVTFDGVAGVKVRGFAPSERERILQILAIVPEPGAICIDFSGDDCVRLEVDGIVCHLEDLGEPWPTPWRPKHPVAEA